MKHPDSCRCAECAAQPVIGGAELDALRRGAELVDRIAQGNGRLGASECAKCGCAFYSADGDDKCAPCAGKVAQCETCKTWFELPGTCPLCEPT